MSRYDARIAAIDVDPAERLVQLDWDDGSRTFAAFGYFDSDQFSKTAIIEGGRKLTWPCGNSVCANRLYVETHSEDRSELRFGPKFRMLAL